MIKRTKIVNTKIEIINTFTISHTHHWTRDFGFLFYFNASALIDGEKSYGLMESVLILDKLNKCWWWSLWKTPKKSTSTHKHSQKYRDRDNERMQLKENHIRKRGETERLAKQQTQQYIQKHISIHFGLWRQPNE